MSNEQASMAEREHSTPQVIAWDVGNVLVEADSTIGHRVLESYGVSQENAQTFYTNPDYFEFCRGNIDGNEFYKALVERHLKYPLTFNQVYQAHSDAIYGVDQNVKAILETMVRQRRRIVFVTDTNDWQMERIPQLGLRLEHYTNEIYSSNRIHMLKDDEEFFPFVQERLRVKNGKDILLIDDSASKIAKAAKHGWSTTRFIGAKHLEEVLHRLKTL